MYICYKNNDVEWLLLSCVYGLHVGNRTLRTINNGKQWKTKCENESLLGSLRKSPPLMWWWAEHEVKSSL